MRIYLGFVGTEVPSVNIIRITVAVIVHAILAIKLGFININIGGKIFVSIIHTAVNYRHEHVLASGRGFPSIEQVNIRTRHTVGDITEVLVMPLFRQVWIIEGHRPGGFNHLGTIKFAEAFRTFLQRHRSNELGTLDTCGCRENLPCFLGGNRLIKIYHIPAVKSVFRSLFCEFLHIRKHRTNTDRFHIACRPVKRCDTRSHCSFRLHQGGMSHLQSHFRLQLHANHSLLRGACACSLCCA